MDSAPSKSLRREFRAWLVHRPGRFLSEFRANAEQLPSSEQIPSKHPEPLYSFVILCSESPWLADNKVFLTSPWGETDHARNLASLGGRVPFTPKFFTKRRIPFTPIFFYKLIPLPVFLVFLYFQFFFFVVGIRWGHRFFVEE